jgi:flagellin
MGLVGFLNPEEPGFTFEGALQILDSALSQLNLGATRLGSARGRIERAMAYSDLVADSLDEGVAGLVEAELDEEASRLAAQQVRESLAADGLRRSNDSLQLTLSLFS